MILITLMLAVLVLSPSVPFALQALSVVCVAICGIGLLYVGVRRW